MNPSAARKGASFAGAVGYITHDPGAKTADRIAFVEVLNLRTADPAKAAKVMAWTAYHAAELKQAAGLPATGRKTENPVYHFSLNWEPGESVSPGEMMTTAKAVMVVLGYSEHEAVLAAHQDKAHQHIHIVLNRIHPVTGKTHNPKNDYEVLQRWAYAYEKARGRVVCLDRAIKYEKDKTLQALYKQQLARQQDESTAKESKPRPQWDAEKDATHPQSQKFKTLRQTFATAVHGLAADTRAMPPLHRQQWDELKARQAIERDELRVRHHQAAKTRLAFAKAAFPVAATWKAFHAENKVLAAQHAVDLRALRSRLQEEDRPSVDRFLSAHKAQWRSFCVLNRAGGLAIVAASLEATLRTPLTENRQQRRGWLGRFLGALVSKDRRAALFAEGMEAERHQFFKGIDARHGLAMRELGQQQRDESRALRARYDDARITIARERKTTVEGLRTEDLTARTTLAKRHGEERAALKVAQRDSTSTLRKQWAALDADRQEAWGDYKQMRQAQARGEAGSQSQGPGLKDAFASRAARLASFEPQGPDYGDSSSARPHKEPPRGRDR